MKSAAERDADAAAGRLLAVFVARFRALRAELDAAMARCAQLEAALSDLMLSVMATSCRDTIVLKDISAARDALKGPR